jgi:putative Mg2+ transporter-C (MgtC) family protein
MLPWIDVLTRLLIAAVLSGLIGLEREFRHKPIGFRTTMLVGLGATLIMLVSLAFTDDPTRVAAGVVTGIGFIGAGLIIQSRGEVHGITTAATIWVVAAVGLAVGIGYYSVAVIGTMFAIAVLLVFGNEKLRDKLKLDD